MASTATHFDLLVIGGGSGGLGCARRAASYGAKVAVFEHSRLGGTCVNVGCVPKKVMFNTARVMETLHDARGYGFEFGDVNFNFQTLKRKRDEYIKYLNGIYGRNLQKDDVTFIPKRASFVNAKTLRAGDELYTADHILIACGGRPAMPDIPGKEFIKNSDDFFNTLEVLPKKAAVVGAGYIAVELGHVMQMLGVDTSLVFRRGACLRSFDEDIQIGTLQELSNAGVTLMSNTTIKEIKENKTGDETTYTLVDQNDAEYSDFDYVLYAIGRGPVSDLLNIDELDIETTPRGHVISDEYECTNVDGIYSLGDINGKVELTPVAVRAGRMLADRLFGGKPEAKMDYVNVPSVVFLDPPIGSIGYSEKAANEEYAGEKITVYRTKFYNMYYRMAEREKKPASMFKIICIGEEERVVGLHLHGLGADEMLQGFGVAMKMGATKEDIDSVVAIHPTASEEVVTMKKPLRTYTAGEERPEEQL